MENIATSDFAVQSTYHILEGNGPGQLVFLIDILHSIKHVVGWIYICQSKQAQIDKSVISENPT